MTHLYASVLRLIARHDARIPMSNGQFAHAAFLRLVSEVDPELGALLHDANSRKPFTVSPLLGGPAPRGGWLHLRSGDECWLRFTLLGSHLFKMFTQQFVLGATRPTLLLGNPGQEAQFEIAEVRTTHGSHTWAGSTSAEGLVAQAQRGERAEREVTLNFYTPTAFSDVDKRAMLLPLPEFVFGNLAQMWLEMGLNTALDLSEWINLAALQGEVDATQADGTPTNELTAWRALFAQHVAVKKLREVNTQVMQLNRQPFIGFTGTVTFEVFGAEPFCRIINLLADCALYFGVGRKTTMGMGQCRRIYDF